VVFLYGEQELPGLRYSTQRSYLSVNQWIGPPWGDCNWKSSSQCQSNNGYGRFSWLRKARSIAKQEMTELESDLRDEAAACCESGSLESVLKGCR
jgi:hypothetical protein